ncbi:MULTISPECIES: bifunctional DNA primase/polymerase [Prauserella salsuginis group]|uniref:Bifunctional DNA primase/polymerase n=1 Tax=Prauserella salsuginis TaxID=387889 RepID=A0ABW6G2C7_9PSEU|nr:MULTISPECIES: bifunctional DNA primase/polymerase [Prauserella salsuginis group]MCR3719928.1 Bifunctional DNA primase/polymerase, N-terminal [Prauserella flava]MCR3736528.1 Bifunctional DNA primase/polymerase, N-terminal [Prauserella salsuginis]
MHPTASPALTEWALYFAAMGWHVFPLAPRDKRPAIKAWEGRATTEVERITRCWQAGAFNIGIATGPSRLLVLDLDTADPGDTDPDGTVGIARVAEERGVPLPETYTVATPSGGRHLYFALPEGVELRNTAGQLAPHVDTRAGGGYVVGPGSTLPAGGYELVDDRDPAPLPPWLLQVLCQRPAFEGPVRSVRAVTEPGRYAAAALRGECEAVAAAPAGQHNAVLSRAAWRVGQLVGAGLCEPDHARGELLHAAQTLIGADCGCTPGEIARVVDAALTKGAQHPRHVPNREAA